MLVRRWSAIAVTGLVLSMVGVACTDVESPSPGDGGDTGGTKPGTGITVKLAVNPWTGAAVNANVAAAILEGELGYTVELVEVDEFVQFPSLSDGSLDATLEVWPSGHADDYATYIEGDGSVVDAGPLGAVGKIDWYVPTFMLDENPELATWGGLNENAELFATAETEPKGQFLLGDPSYVSFDAQIIENLGLDFVVVTGGSEATLVTSIERAIENEEPLLLYMYTPHWVHNDYDLSVVELPAYTDECAAAAAEEGAAGYACEYPEDVLYKALSAQLEDKAPEAFEFLSNMNYTSEIQATIAKEIDVEGVDAADAAQAWVDANEDVWSAWLPAA